MDLTPYLQGLRRDLAAVGAAGGPDAAQAADLLAGSLEPAARLYLLEALSDAAAEITTRLARGSVEVRLRGREAQFVVEESVPTAPSALPPDTASLVPPTPPPQPGPGQPAATDGDLARITLRLPEALKEAVEQAAANEGISVNAWLVRAIAQIVGAPAVPGLPGGRLGRRVTGFAQA